MNTLHGIKLDIIHN